MRVLSVLPVLAEVSTWVYVGACVALPLAWGVTTEFFFRWLSRHHKRRKRKKDEHFFIDYHI